MNFKKYKIKMTIFVLTVIFSMIFSSWILFFLYKWFSQNRYIKNRLENSSKIIKKMNKNQIDNFLQKIDELYVKIVISETMADNKIDITKEINKNIWVKYIYIKLPEWVFFQNFNINKCNKNLVCKTIKKWKYTIIIAEKYDNIQIRYNLIIFAIFSFFVSVLFFPLIFWIVSKLTKPIEQNYEFMKNFVNNAWHELKTPIANINLSTQILNQKKEYNQEIINDILGESTKISQLIDTLLQMSTLSKFEKKDNMILKEIIENIINEFKTEIEAKNIGINLELKNIHKNINKNQIEILLRNLIKNAIKYNFKNWTINIVLDENKLVIENTGNEIKNWNKKRIFDLFYRIDKNQEWYGLWLAIVKKIIDINKWKIKVKSENWVNSFIIEF